MPQRKVGPADVTDSLSGAYAFCYEEGTSEMPRHNPCSRCGEMKQKGKKANCYVSWYVGDDRTTFYTSWGVACFIADIQPLMLQQSENDKSAEPICLVCGEKIEGEPEVVYATLFLPKQEQVDLEFTACPAECWPLLRNNLAKGGVFKPERGRGPVGAQAQAPTDSDPWAGIAAVLR